MTMKSVTEEVWRKATKKKEEFPTEAKAEKKHQCRVIRQTKYHIKVDVCIFLNGDSIFVISLHFFFIHSSLRSRTLLSK